MKSEQNLPAGYAPVLHIDLQKDKKAMWLVNGSALGIAAVLVVVGLLLVPFATVYAADGIGTFVAKMLVLGVGSIVYIIAHELVHGIFMKRFSGMPVKYGFTGLYAYAGSKAYFCKKHYIIIALAPIVVWGVVLAVLNAVLPIGWFWPVYIIQISNLSGAAGDLYVSILLRKQPADILVQDDGTSMTVYGKV